jgi:hypothetical protein
VLGTMATLGAAAILLGGGFIGYLMRMRRSA